MGHLENYRKGNSLKSTNEDSLGESGRMSNANKMEAFKNKLNAVNKSRTSVVGGDLNSSIDKHSEFKNKMA